MVSIPFFLARSVGDDQPVDGVPYFQTQSCVDSLDAFNVNPGSTTP